MIDPCYITWASIKQRGFFILFSTTQPTNKRWLARQLDEARREGRGVKVQDWKLAGESPELSFADTVVEWCKESLANCRRPYGIDHFDLVLALRNGEHVTKLSFPKLRAPQLYGDALPHQVITAIQKELGETRDQVIHVAAGFFSWGDALHSVLGSREPQPASN